MNIYVTDTRPRRDDKLASFVTVVFVAIRAVEAAHTYFRASSATTTKLEFLSRVLAYYRDRIFRQRCVFCRFRWKRRRRGGEGEGEKTKTRMRHTDVMHEEEEDEQVDEARRRGGERRIRTPTMRRRYATEYHYPDNGPAISSTACINLRVKGQDTRYLNK